MWQPPETAPYGEVVLAWVYLPKNPPASGCVIANRCYVQEDDPESYGDMRRTVGCWWANGLYYHDRPGQARVTHWQPLPPPPAGG